MIIAHTFVFGERERFPPVECLVRESLTGGKKRENDFLWRSQEEDKRPGIDQQGRIAFSRSFLDFEKKSNVPSWYQEGGMYKIPRCIILLYRYELYERWLCHLIIMSSLTWTKFWTPASSIMDLGFGQLAFCRWWCKKWWMPGVSDLKK